MKKISDSVIVRLLSLQSKIEDVAKLNLDEHLVNKDSVVFLTSLIERKISHSFKNIVLKKIKEESIIIINTPSIPNYLTIFPSFYKGKIVSVINVAFLIGNVKDTTIPIENFIEYRTLYSLLVFSLTQLALIHNYDSAIINNYEFAKIVSNIYSKMLLKIIDKMTGLFLMDDVIKDSSVALCKYFALFYILERDKANSLHYALNNSGITEVSRKSNLLTNELLSSITNFETFIEALITIIPNAKIKPVNVVKEYTTFYRTNGVLSIDLVQYLVPMLMSVEAFSSNFFADLLISKLLEKEIGELKTIMFRYTE